MKLSQREGLLGRMPVADLLVERDPIHEGHPHIAEDSVVGTLG